MKNVLIPTTLKPDTLDALKAVGSSANGSKIQVVLLMLSEMPDGITDLLFSTKSGIETEIENVKTLRACKAYVASKENITLQVHHQYGISGPLLRNIMEHYDTGLIVLTPSYKQEKESIHRQAVKVVNSCKCPILHLPEKVREFALDHAIYLENQAQRLSVTAVQQLLKKEFDIRVVRQAKISEGQELDELSPVLNETIKRDQIPLVVETRKADKKWTASSKNHITLAETLGVPVLSIVDN